MSILQNMAENRNVLLWKKLRSPFALTSRMKSLHTCQWENIEIDVLGCLTCGAIHHCHADTCEVVHTSDSTVCVISGVCVKTKNFKQEDFCDRVAPYCFCLNSLPAKRIVSESTVYLYINEILCSEKTRQSFHIDVRREFQKLLLKFTHMLENKSVQESLQHGDKTCSIIHIVEQIFATNGKKAEMLCCYNEALRMEYVEAVVPKITRILNFYQMHCQKSIKPMEVKTYVVGLLYLMRSGVIVNNHQVITKIEILQCLLPSENLLETIFGFKSKNITDIENRFKFFFRQISTLTLQTMCL
jgi:hypothetical protein